MQCIERHPRCPISLTQRSSGREGLRAVKHSDVVQAEEASFEDVVSSSVLAVHPPSEVEQQLLEDALEEGKILRAVELTLNLENTEGSPGYMRRLVERLLRTSERDTHQACTGGLTSPKFHS